MKIKGAEFMEWYDNHFPPGDWYHDGCELETHDDQGNWLLDPAATYDSDELGGVFYQGNENPIPPLPGARVGGQDGYQIAGLIRKWRRDRDFDMLTIEVPKARVDEIKALLAGAGVKVKL